METTKAQKVLTPTGVEELTVGTKKLGELAEDRKNPLFWKKRLNEAKDLLSGDVSSQLDGIGLLRSIVSGIGSSEKFRRPETKDEAINNLLELVDNSNPEIRIASIFALGSLGRFMSDSEIGITLERIEPHARYNVMGGEDNTQVVQVSMMSLMQLSGVDANVLNILDEQLDVNNPLINAQAAYALTFGGASGIDRIMDRLARNPEKSELLVGTLVSTGRQDVLREIVTGTYNALEGGRYPALRGTALLNVLKGLLSIGDEKDLESVVLLFESAFKSIGDQQSPGYDDNDLIDPILRSDPEKIWPRIKGIYQEARDRVITDTGEVSTDMKKTGDAYRTSILYLMDLAVDLNKTKDPVGLDIAKFVTEGFVKAPDSTSRGFMYRFKFRKYSGGIQLRNNVRDALEGFVEENWIPEIAARGFPSNRVVSLMDLLMDLDDPHSLGVVKKCRDVMEQGIRKYTESDIRRHWQGRAVILGDTYTEEEITSAINQTTTHRLQNSQVPALDKWIQSHEK